MGEGVPTLDGKGVPTFDWGHLSSMGGGTYLGWGYLPRMEVVFTLDGGRGYLPLMGEGIPTLDGETSTINGRGYLPQM